MSEELSDKLTTFNINLMDNNRFFKWYFYTYLGNEQYHLAILILAFVIYFSHGLILAFM